MKAKELAEAHWNYIKAVLTNHKMTPDEIDRIGFHYRTAMIHGYKHGWVDAMDELGKPLFMPFDPKQA